MASSGAATRGRAVLLSTCQSGAWLREQVLHIADRHDELIVAVEEGSDAALAPLALRWSAARACLAPLANAWATALVHTPSLPRLIDRCAALTTRLGAFDALYTDSASIHDCAERLGLPSERLREVEPSAGPTLVSDAKRALVVTRAQPFHRGHLALVEHALAQADEVLLVVAAAERSHAARDPFTAGERLAMVRAGLGTLRDRVWLVALPSPPWAAMALTELCMVCPRYDVVVAHNPVLRALAAQQGTPVEGLTEPFAVSGHAVSATQVREHLCRDGASAALKTLVPDAVAALLMNVPSLSQRCALIAAAGT